MVSDSDYSFSLPKLPDYSTQLAYSMPEISIPANPVYENLKANYASAFYERLGTWITEFDADLDEEHEVGVRLVSFGQSVVFRLDTLGYCNPSLISFAGTLEDGSPVELVQHVSQISILLMRLPRLDPETPKQPFGFCPPQAESQDDESE